MKKLLSLASAVILGLSAIPMSVSAADNVDVNGIDLRYDLNQDGVVDRTDFKSVMVYLGVPAYKYEYVTIHDGYGNTVSGYGDVKFDISDETKSYIEANGDLDGNGVVNALDANVILYALLDNGVIPTDFNFDGKFTADVVLHNESYTDNDAACILGYYAEVQTESYDILSDEVRNYVAENGDINCDDFIDARDAVFLISYYLKDEPKGDVNGDGVINAVDASLVLSYYADVQTGGIGSDPELQYSVISAFGDVNGDGVVNAVDASAILSIYAENQTT